MNNLVKSTAKFERVFRMLGACALALMILAPGWAFAQTAPTELVFGPKIYTRTTGTPVTVTDTFSIPSGTTAPFMLRIENGDPAVPGANRVTSATVTLNGVQVAGPSEFGNQVTLLEKPVTLSGASNSISVSLAGSPGAAFRLRILGTPIQTVPTALAPNPLTITAGATGNLTVNLSPSPLSAGNLAVTSANSGVATVPASVNFNAGQTSVAIPVTGVAQGNATVTATLNGGSASATINVTPALPTVASLLPSSLLITQGANGTLTVTLTSAPVDNTSVSLASSAPGVASVPASVIVPAGQLTVSLPVNGLSPGTSQVSASLNGSTVASQITVNPAPPTVVSLLPVTTNVTLGASTGLTLTISAAQTADTVIPVSVTPPGIASSPAQVVVPAGQTSTTVVVSAVAFGQAGVTASLNGSSASAVVNVIAPPVAVVSLVPSPFTMNVGAVSTFTVTINATQSSNTEIALAVNNPGLLQVPMSVTVAQGQLSTTFTVTALATGNAVIIASANGTSQGANVHIAPQPAAIVSLLPNPLPLQQGVTGTLTVTLNVAQEAVTTVAVVSSNAGIAQAPASISIPAGQISTPIPINTLTAGDATITVSVNNTSASALVQVTPPPPAVTGITPGALTLPKGTPGTLRVAVSRAPITASAVVLSSSNPAFVSVPPTVNIPAGALFADFPVTANAQGQATISATLNGGTATAAITVTPAELTLLTLSPQTPTAYIGESISFTATGTMTDGSTQNLTTQATWSSSDSIIASIANTGVASALATGQTTISSSYTFMAAQTGQSVTISVNTALTVRAPGALVLSAPSSTLQSGQSTIVTVQSSDAPPLGGLTVSLTQSGTGTGSFPATVVIPEFESITTFTFTANTAGSVTLTATAPNRLPGALALTVASALSITSIAPTSGAPGTIVTFNGTGFDPKSASNQVSFTGNATSPVLTATATRLTVAVPQNAQTGPISVTNANGTAVSPPFTVTQGEQDFQLVASPANVTVYQGASNTAQAQIASTGTNPYTGLVRLNVQGLPAGVTAAISPAATLSAFQSGAITFSSTAAAVPGNYTVTVQATGPGNGFSINRSATISLTVAAATGVTGIKGRFVTPEGQGIAGIIVRADIGPNPQPQTVTDAAGNFVLIGLTAGAVTFRFDATPANPLYPIWPYSVPLAANTINVMPDWTINPPPADDKFTPISNAAQDQFITDSRYPGLAIKLPAGVTITGWDGVVKTRIAIEQVDISKIPVSPPPAPVGAAYQMYFGTPMGGIPSAPIPVTLPNDTDAEPGTSVPVYFFDGSPMGGSGEWKIAGQGIVDPNGKTVSMPAGTGIPRFCGVCGLVCLGKQVSAKPGKGCPRPTAGNPVNLYSGQELPSTSGLSCGGLTPIDTGMSYDPIDAFNNIGGISGSVGLGWTLDYDVVFLPFSGPQKRLLLPPNEGINFVDDGSGNYRSFDDPRFDGAVIRALNAASNEWELAFKDGRKWRFNPFTPVVTRGGPTTFLTEMIDAAGNSLRINRRSDGRITSVGSGIRNVTMTYGGNGFVSEMRDTANRVTSYSYTSTNRIATMTDADNKVTSYTYVNDSEIPPAPVCAASQPAMGERIKTIQYPGRTNPTTNFYGSARRVLRQLGYDGLETRMDYRVTGACVTHTSAPNTQCTANCPDTDSWENFQAGWRIHGGRVIATTVTEPNGTTKRYTYNAVGAMLSSTDGLGQQDVRKLDAVNRVIQRTDAIGRTWKYQYDAQGNRIQEIDPLNRVMDYAFDPKWNLTTTATRYLPGNTPVVNRFTYDTNTSRLISTIDPLNNTTTLGYTLRAELSSITVPGNRTMTLEYNDAGDLVRMADPLGNETLYQTDGAGRRIRITDPLGFDTRTEYNGIDQITKTIDPLAQETRLTYDPAQRLASVIDPRNNAIESYQYDSGDRVTAVTDALNRATSHQYDNAGRLSQFTDRKGQVTTYSYDNVNRVTSINYPGGSRSIDYDAAGRVSRVAEPGTAVRYTYDAVDRVVSVTTDSVAGQHTVGYEYDTLDRVTRRTLNGADPTDYTWDAASRLATIIYRGQTTTYTWDGANRLTNKTLPNGIKQIFTYDNADRLLSIAYQKADNTPIETITYTYDAKGQRLTKAMSGTSSRETAFTATYNAANRMAGLTLNGVTYSLSYDDNGNLAAKTDTGNASNTTTYAWDSRNRLTGISAPGINASFSYDALGRRVEKTVNGNTVNYVYDGAQAIAEVTGGTVSAAILTGLNLDEVLARYAASGNRTYLTDALNTVIAQANDTQAIENYYTYTPYGETQTLGPDGGNPIQYTARENDQTGLYYYRARYYDPVLKRFVSEDPIGIAGGLNLYGYVGGDPLSFVDPLGNRAELISIVIIAASIAIYTDAANILINLITPVQNRIDGLNKADQFAPPGAQGSADFDPKTGVPYGILEQRRSHEEVKNFKRDFFDIGKGATELISPSPASLIKDIAKICR